MANYEIKPMAFSHEVFKIASKCQVSGNDSVKLLEFHDLAQNKNSHWKSYKDKKILDVCAGLSDLTAKHLKLGADAYALDYGYQDVTELFIRAGNRPAGTFLNSFNINRNRYIAASVHDIPFESDSFDAVTSYYGIFGAIDDNFDLTKIAIDESIRVIKPNGVVSIGPYRSGHTTSRHIERQEKIIDYLLDKKDVQVLIKDPYRQGLFSVEPDISRMGKLTIIKL